MLFSPWPSPLDTILTDGAAFALAAAKTGLPLTLGEVPLGKDRRIEPEMRGRCPVRVLGVDPGTALVGYGVVETVGSSLRWVCSGVIKTAASDPTAVRLLHIHRQISKLIADYTPDLLAVEELFFGRNVTTAMTVGQARGVVLLSAGAAAVPVAEYTPMQVKMAVTGWGRADKPQVQQMVKSILNLSAPPRPDDVADALAVALCAAQSWPLQQRLGRV